MFACQLTQGVPRAAIIGVAVLTFVVGCARQDTATVPDSQDGGVVHVACGATEEWCAATTQAFTRKTGVKADFVRLSSGEALARIKAGKSNPEFDIWYGGPADGYAAGSNEGLLEKYVSPNASAIPAKYRSVDGSWTGIYVGVLGFCGNRKVLADKGVAQPESWADLLNPRLAKQISIAHPSTSGTAYTALWTHVVLNGQSEDNGLNYMRKLHPNVLQYTKSGSGPAQMAARGEVAVGVIFSHDCVATKESGFPDLAITFPSEGTGYEIGGIAMVKGARNPVSARKYVDWALTAEAQEIGPTVRSYQLPTNPQAKTSDKVADLSRIKLVEYDAVQAGKAKPALTKRFDNEVAQAPKS